jgi:hypothetical protein
MCGAKETKMATGYENGEYSINNQQTTEVYLENV